MSLESSGFTLECSVCGGIKDFPDKNDSNYITVELNEDGMLVLLCDCGNQYIILS